MKSALFFGCMLAVSPLLAVEPTTPVSTATVNGMPKSIPDYRPEVRIPSATPEPASHDSGGITLNFQNTDIDLVLKFFSEVTDKIFLKSDSVRGFVTLTVPRKVTVEQAMDVLQTALDLKGFTLVPGAGQLIKVVTQSEAIQNSSDVGYGIDEVAGNGEDRLITQVIPLRFISASDLRNQLTPMLTKVGTVIPDERTNSIVVTDMSSNIRRLAKIIQSLDSRTPQVLIEVLILEVTLTDELKLGVEWSYNAPFQSRGDSFQGQASQSFDLGNVISEGLKYAIIRSDLNLKATIQALATNKDVNVLSTPHILTLNNQPAVIRVGEEIPVLTQTRNIQGGETIRSFDYKTVAVELEVTPRINPDREVQMKVHPMVRKILGFNAELNAPILATREAQTNVLVQDGQTVVLGGLIKDDRSLDQSKVPLLGDVPLIGNFFKRKGVTREKTELLVFITPRVVGNADQARALTIRKESEVKEYQTPYRLEARQELALGESFAQEGRCGDAVDHLKRAISLTIETKLRKRAQKVIDRCRPAKTN